MKYISFKSIPPAVTVSSPLLVLIIFTSKLLYTNLQKKSSIQQNIL